MQPLLALTLALAVAAGACTPQRSDGVLVAAAFHPVADTAAALAGPAAEVVDLTPPGAEPHDVELTTRQLDRVLDADVVLYFGGGFQPSVERAAARAGDKSVDLLAGLEGARADDPHVWLDPVLMTAVVARLRDALVAAVPPEAAAGVRRRAEERTAQLAALDVQYRRVLGSCQRRLLVTTHAAFRYLADRYGLRVESLAGTVPHAEPDPARLGQLADLVRRSGTTTVFGEGAKAERAAAALARESGAAVATLDPLENGSGGGYLEVMRANLRALAAGLGCPAQ